MWIDTAVYDWINEAVMRLQSSVLHVVNSTLLLCIHSSMLYPVCHHQSCALSLQYNMHTYSLKKPQTPPTAFIFQLLHFSRPIFRGPSHRNNAFFKARHVHFLGGPPIATDAFSRPTALHFSRPTRRPTRSPTPSPTLVPTYVRNFKYRKKNLYRTRVRTFSQYPWPSAIIRPYSWCHPFSHCESTVFSHFESVDSV